MANLVYNYFKQAVLQGSFNLGSFPVYGTLVGSNYTPNDDTHKYRSDLSEVVTPSNYTAAFALSSPAVSLNTSTNQGVFDAADGFNGKRNFRLLPFERRFYLEAPALVQLQTRLLFIVTSQKTKR